MQVNIDVILMLYTYYSTGAPKTIEEKVEVDSRSVYVGNVSNIYCT